MLGSPKLGNPLIVDGVIVFKLIFLDFTHWIRIQNINETNPCESGYTSQPERQLGTLAYGIPYIFIKIKTPRTVYETNPSPMVLKIVALKLNCLLYLERGVEPP